MPTPRRDSGRPLVRWRPRIDAQARGAERVVEAMASFTVGVNAGYAAMGPARSGGGGGGRTRRGRGAVEGYRVAQNGAAPGESGPSRWWGGWGRVW